MSNKSAAKLLVVVTANRRYIDVPSGRANSLHKYLRDNSIASSPPEPFCSDMDSIELAKGANIEAVQLLLDQFS